MKRFRLTLIIVCIVMFDFATVLYAKELSKTNTNQLMAENKNICFIENKGQILDDNGKFYSDILYMAKGKGIKFFLTKKGIIYNWIKTERDSDSQDKKIRFC